eukprot:scpid97673/ scgid2603/ Brain-specific angiogenesis inhibitor 1
MRRWLALAFLIVVLVAILSLDDAESSRRRRSVRRYASRRVIFTGRRRYIPVRRGRYVRTTPRRVVRSTRRYRRTGTYYASWSQWSACTASCGEGMQKRTRCCKGTVSACMAMPPILQTRTCRSSSRCPGGYYYSPWGAWSHCSHSCGDGVSYRKRCCRGSPILCIYRPPQMETMACNLGLCATPGRRCYVQCTVFVAALSLSELSLYIYLSLSL